MSCIQCEYAEEDSYEFCEPDADVVYCNFDEKLIVIGYD